MRSGKITISVSGDLRVEDKETGRRYPFSEKEFPLLVEGTNVVFSIKDELSGSEWAKDLIALGGESFEIAMDRITDLERRLSNLEKLFDHAQQSGED